MLALILCDVSKGAYKHREQTGNALYLPFTLSKQYSRAIGSSCASYCLGRCSYCGSICAWCPGCHARKADRSVDSSLIQFLCALPFFVLRADLVMSAVVYLSAPLVWPVVAAQGAATAIATQRTLAFHLRSRADLDRSSNLDEF
jgi:hypothetical protein